MIATLRQSQVTVLFLVIVWLFFGLRLGIESIYGEEAVLALFVVRFSHVEYAWTWVTAPLGHGNLTHLLFNSMLALFIIPPVERELGRNKTGVAYIVGGALCAVIGTVLVAFVRLPFLTDATDVGGIGSSIGLFVLLGITLRQYWSYQSPLLARTGIALRNATLFGVLFVGSLGGIVFDIWRQSVEFSFPGLGHHYHAVGLLIGAAIIESVSVQQNDD